MENISRALLMAAGILLCILTIAIAMLLFRAGAGVSTAYQRSNEENELNIFNNNFLKMIAGNDNSSISGQKRVDSITIYDVITTANFAWNNNCYYVDNPTSSEYSNDPRILRVTLNYGSGKIENLQDYTQEAYDLIIKAGHFNNTTMESNSTKLPEPVYYKINITGYSPVGRINKVEFSSKTNAIVDSQIRSAVESSHILTDSKFKRKIY